MPTVAFLTAGCMLAGHPQLRVDHWEHDLELGPMRAGCAERGIDLRAVVWDDPGLEPEAFDAFVIGTTWDYTDRPAEFLQALEDLAARRPLYNPLPTVRWNLRKTYLRELAAKGVSVVPTLWHEHADAATIEAAFDQLGVDEVVVKPEVGASAWRQARVRRGAPLPPEAELPPARAMLQPFLADVAREGELSFVFFDRAFSHCARKIPRAGDYRVQSMYGAREHVHVPSAGELALAQHVVDAVEGPLLHARVDMLRGLDGRLALVELELVEPYLYPEQGPHMGRAFAAALQRMLERA